MLFVRLVRSFFAFGVIFFSYLVHLGLVRLFGEVVRDEGAPSGPRRFETRKLPRGSTRGASASIRRTRAAS